jgi:O-antigen biosynthesis protein
LRHNVNSSQPSSLHTTPDQPAERRAADTLAQLLDADDLLSALERFKDRFDPDLVALIHQNAEAARDGGEAALAESLEDLAGYIEQALAAPPPAPAPAPAKPAQYYAFARPEVARLVPDTAVRILDVGCGAGWLGASLKARGNTEVVGIEINPAAAAEAATRLDRVCQVDLNGQDPLPFPLGYFDCLIFADVLEHLVEPGQVLRWLMRYLQPEGCVVISLPNVRHYSVVQDLLVNGQWIYATAGILDRTHLRFFTWESVLGLLREVGLRGDEVEPVLTPANPVIDQLLKVVQAAGGNVDQARLELQTYQFVFRARPEQVLVHPVMPLPADTLVSIIILTLNNVDLTRQCLESIEANTPPEIYELILVDNGSTDETVEFLREYAGSHANVTVVVNAENRGFAAGNNLGLALARGNYVLFLNNDTVLTETWLERMLSVFQYFPTAGLVGPMAKNTAGPQQVTTVAYDSLDEMRVVARRWAAEHNGESEEVVRAIGFCLLARQTVIDAIGGLDEQFGLGNYEDDDFCLRAAYAGFTTRLARDAFIHHIGSQTFSVQRINYRNMLLGNWEIFKKKWGLPPEAPVKGGYKPPTWVPATAVRRLPLPDVREDHDPEMAGRWWTPRPKPTAANLAAAETLRQLLAADDMETALRDLADYLDTDLLALVQQNAKAARRDGDPELAEGLDSLAAYIAQEGRK